MATPDIMERAEEAVVKLAEIIDQRREFTEDSLYAAMAEAGIPGGLADRAYKFTQFAWGRVFLDGLDIQFSPDYYWLDTSGLVVESGRLDDDPCYAKARRLAPKYSRNPGFGRFALMSAEVQAVNSALNAGSQAKDLALAPAVAFREAPTPEGLQRARAMISKLLAQRSPKSPTPAGKVTPPSKPWWRFW